MDERMHVTLGMIALNEEEFIGRTLAQHYDLVDKIVVVEGADTLYPKERVTADGLSTDATAEIVRSFPDPSNKITFIQHGWTQRSGDQAKCELRNRYAEETPDGLLAVVDADEAYTHDDFAEILRRAKDDTEIWAWCYPFVHFWKSTSQFITGGYYDVGHIRFWRWKRGMRYWDNHNFPEWQGKHVQRYGRRVEERKAIPNGDGYAFAGPIGYHFGFMKGYQAMRDKTDYYKNRGECATRPKTIESREAWFQDGSPLGIRFWKYTGVLPEKFADLK
jgi:glycosyltransferase involved in cell wall biosynthesis